jgi:hypothetical protein
MLSPRPMAAVLLFGITLIPDILDKYHIIHIPRG